jgi:hypothetical protein
MRGSIVSIVEGHGEIKAVPALLHKLLKYLEVSDVHVASPIRIPRGTLVSPGELERALELAHKRRKNVGAILVLIDADKDCPALIGFDLLERARKAIHLPVAVVLAKKEFETWFLGCLERYRGFMGIPDNVLAPDKPEELGGKGTLEGIMIGFNYLPRIHQVDFVRKMEPEDLILCRERCPSFDKLERDVKRLVESITKAGEHCGS